MDGQTERMNQTLEAYLHIFYNYDQNDWFELLPLAEFTYNNAVQESTKMSPFFANHSFHWHFLAELRCHGGLRHGLWRFRILVELVVAS